MSASSIAVKHQDSTMIQMVNVVEIQMGIQWTEHHLNHLLFQLIGFASGVAPTFAMEAVNPLTTDFTISTEHYAMALQIGIKLLCLTLSWRSFWRDTTCVPL